MVLPCYCCLVTLCNSIDHSPPGSSLCITSQARILEQVAISSSRGSSQPKDWTRVSYISGGFFTAEPSGELAHRYMFVYTHAYCTCVSTYLCACIYCCWNDFRNCISDGVSATFVCLVVYEDSGRTMRETWGKRICVNGKDANGGVDWKWKLQKCYMQNVVLHGLEGAMWIPDDYKLQIRLFIPSSCCLNDFHKPNCCPGY